MKQIVIIGAGDWVKKQYAKELRLFKKQNKCVVHIIYNSDVADYITLHNVADFMSWGFSCLDSVKPKDKNRIKNLIPHSFFIVTPPQFHCDQVMEWLDRTKETIIYVEKPFDVNPKKIKKLRNKIEKSNRHVFGIDHYLLRANQFMKKRDYLQFDNHMEEHISKFEFCMLESRNDIKERAKTLKSGIIMDMLSHTLAMLLPFIDINDLGIELKSIQAGICKGVPINSETFVYLGFKFNSIFGHGHKVEATACAGKCVGEVDEKYVIVKGGKSGNKEIRLDLKNYIVDFVDKDKPMEMGPVTSLFGNFAHLLIRETLEEREGEHLALIGLKVAEMFITQLLEWQSIIDNKLKNAQLDEYIENEPKDNIIKRLKFIPLP